MIRTTSSIAWFAAIALAAVAGPVRAQDGTALTPKSLQAALDAKPTGCGGGAARRQRIRDLLRRRRGIGARRGGED